MSTMMKELNLATINELLRMMSLGQLKSVAAMRVDVYENYEVNKSYPSTLYVERTDNDRWKVICVEPNLNRDGLFNNLYEIPENKDHLGKPSFMRKDSIEYKCLRAKIGEKKQTAEMFVRYSIGFNEFQLNNSATIALNDTYLTFYIGTFLGPENLSKDRIYISFMYKPGRRWFYIKPEEILKEQSK